MNEGAVLRESQGNGLPNAATGACDHGDFAVEAESLRLASVAGQSETPRFQGMKSS